MEVSLNYVFSASIPLSQCFESFESSILQKKTKMAKQKLTIFQIQQGDVLTICGRIGLTLLYSAPWVKICSDENSVGCDCFLLVFSFFYVCVAIRIRCAPLLIPSESKTLSGCVKYVPGFVPSGFRIAARWEPHKPEFILPSIPSR
jgi:hypothetical protein